MKWFINRLREPSTWAGFAGMLPAVIAASQGPITPQVVGGIVAGAAAVLMKEKAE